ncbi:hypothetical protein C8R45DRAFT_1046812 [Mycena sanguinolenta]|nr:hypothetical protein C8R45DRAFT_1046812 [Mycena sanguinolenta]
MTSSSSTIPSYRRRSFATPAFPARSEPALHPPQRRSTPRPLCTSPLPATVSEAVDVDVDVHGTAGLFYLLLAPNSSRFCPNLSLPRCLGIKDGERTPCPCPCCHRRVLPMPWCAWKKAEATAQHGATSTWRQTERRGGGGSREEGMSSILHAAYHLLDVCVAPLSRAALYCGLRLFRVIMGTPAFLHAILLVLRIHTLPSS